MSTSSSPHVTPTMPDADAEHPDDPLDVDFVEFTTRLLSTADQDPPPMPYSKIIREAQQVHMVGRHHEDGLPPHAFYEDVYDDGRDSQSENQDVDSLQGLGPGDKMYRMRWTPRDLYRLLITTVKRKYQVFYCIDEMRARMEPYTDFILSTAAQDTEQSQDDAESVQDEIPETALGVPTSTACSILHLPSELLCDIVLLARDDDALITFTISYVNQFLRALTLDYALLWATIDVMYGSERAAIQLQRSREAPLTIRASIPPMFSFDASMTIINRTIALLSNHTTRIVQLEATSISPVVLEVFFNHILSVPEKLPLLRKVTFGMVNRCSNAIASGRLPFAKVGSWEMLTSLSLLGVSGDLQLSLPIGLVELYIEEAHAVDILKFLRSLRTMGPTLQKLSLAHSTFSSATPQEIRSIGAVQLVRLGALDINCLYGKDIDTFRDALITPNLTTLMYATREVTPQEWTDAFLLHAARNCSHLRTLVLRDCGPKLDTWKALADGLRELEKLHLRWCTLRPDDMLTFHSPSNDQDGALPYPCLSELILDNEFYLSSSDIVGLLKNRRSSRGESTSGIDSLVMRGWDKTVIDDNDVRVIQELVGKLTLTVFDGEDIEASDSSLGDGGWDSTADWDSGDEAVIKKKIQLT